MILYSSRTGTVNDIKAIFRRLLSQYVIFIISSKMGIPVSEYLRERCVPTNMAIKEIALQVPDRARAQPRFCVEEIFHWPRA